MRRDRRVWWIVLLALVAVLAALSAGSLVIFVHEKDSIFETVFRYQMDHLVATHSSEKVNAYFLCTDDKDPSTALLRRLRGRVPPVKRYSECTQEEQGMIVRDRQTGQRGVILDVSELHWLSPHRVEVAAADIRNGTDAYGSRITLERTLGRWHVTAEHLEWVS